MPKKGPDRNKIIRIIRILKKNPQGLWLREIARRTEISKSTVHKYINTYMKKDIEDLLIGEGKFIRIVRLKK